MNKLIDVGKQKVKSASSSMLAPSLLCSLPEWLQLVLRGLLTGVLCPSNSVAILLRKNLTRIPKWSLSILGSEIGSPCEAFPQGCCAPMMSDGPYPPDTHEQGYSVLLGWHEHHGETT